MKFKSTGILLVFTTTSILSAHLVNEHADRFALSLWWTILSTISVFNVCLWYYSAVEILPHRSSNKFQFQQILLSSGYVFGCAFRSVMPRADVQRICLIDSWFSNVLVGRCVATVAELCFAAQWALVLHTIAMKLQSPYDVMISKFIFP